MIVYLPLIGGLDRIEPRKHCVHNTASQKEEKFMPEVTMIKNNNARDIWCAIMVVWPREILIVQLAVARPIKMSSNHATILEHQTDPYNIRSCISNLQQYWGKSMCDSKTDTYLMIKKKLCFFFLISGCCDSAHFT